MKKWTLYTFIALIAFSCGEQTTESSTENSGSKNDVDSSGLTLNLTEETKLLLSYFQPAEWPYTIDSLYYENLSSEEGTLTAADVKWLTSGFVDSDLSYSAQSVIKDVLYFDSLKIHGEYDAYVDALDIGMMKDANAFALHKLELDDNGYWLIWYVDFTTYEACPYFAGKTIYATAMKNNVATSCTLIGESSGGGDAPYWGENLILTDVFKDLLRVTKIDRSGGDTDEDGNELVEESILQFEIELSEDGIWQISKK